MSYSSTILAEANLVNYWRLNETSGTSAADSKGSTALTYSGGFTLNQTALIHEGASVLLNGSTGKISQASPITTATANVTLEAWFKLNSTTTSRQVIFSNGNGSNGYALAINGNNASKTLECLLGGFAWYDTKIVLNTTESYHVALVLDASGFGSIFLNGNFLLQVTDVPRTPTSYFGIGSDSVGFLNGWVQEVAYYNAPLSASTILDHYNAASTTEKARITQIGAGILGVPDPPKARITQIGAGILATGNPKVHINEHGILTIVKLTSVTPTITAGGASLLPSL